MPLRACPVPHPEDYYFDQMVQDITVPFIQHSWPQIPISCTLSSCGRYYFAENGKRHEVKMYDRRTVFIAANIVTRYQISNQMYGAMTNFAKIEVQIQGLPAFTEQVVEKLALTE